MSGQPEITEIIISVKNKGAEKKIIYNDSEKIFKLMSDKNLIFRDIILDVISSMKKELQEIKSEQNK